MANQFHDGHLTGLSYRKLREEAENAPRTRISARNKLRALFPGGGDTHQISGTMSLDDAVLAIASVVLGVSQSKYPFKIALGSLDLYRTFGRPAVRGTILPEEFDAFLCPIDLDAHVVNPKRKLEDSSESSDEAPSKRAKTNEGRKSSRVSQDFALAICETANNHVQRFEVDVAAIRQREAPTISPAESQRIVQQVNTTLRSTVDQGQEMNFGGYIRHVARPYAPARYELHAAVLHAWAYVLDIPLNPRPQHSIDEFGKGIVDLFNIALRGQLTLPLLNRFLYETGYLYPARDLQPFQSIPEKYRRPLQRFCSVEITRPTGNDVGQFDDIARLTSGNQVPLSDVRNAIGSLWRATMRQNFSQTVRQRFSFGTEQNTTYGPASAPLLLLQSYSSGGDPFVYLSSAAIVSPGVIQITHYGVDGERTNGKGLQKETERMVRQSGWHGAQDVTGIRFEHVRASSVLPNDARESAIYAILHAWCLLLGLEIAPSDSRVPSERKLLVDAESIINSAFAGRATVKNIKGFLQDNGFTDDPRAHSIDDQLVTRIQPASWDALTAFIQKRRSKQARSPPQPDTPSLLKPLLESPVQASHAESSQEGQKPTKSNTSGSTLVTEGQVEAKDVKSFESLKERRAPKTPLSKPKASESISKTTAPTTAPHKPGGTKATARKASILKTPSPKKDPAQTVSSRTPTPKISTSEPSNIKSPAVLEKSATVETRRSSRSKTPIGSTVSKSPSKSPQASKRSTPEKPKPSKTSQPTPPATVLPWGEYRNPAKYHMYDTSDCDSESWMHEFKTHLQRCHTIRDNLRAMDPTIKKQKFTDENGTKPSHGADITIVGELVASLWKPLWDRTIKFGLVDINHVRHLQDRELSYNGFQPAVGGPYPCIMAMHGTSINPSPEPGGMTNKTSDMGHIWLAVASIREEDLLDKDGNPTLRESTKDHPIHVDVQVYDTQPGLLLDAKKYGKPEGLVRYSGWATGSIQGIDNHEQVALLPRHWDPTVMHTDIPCPNQYSDRPTKRTNACGLLTTLHTWMVMLDLPIAATRGGRHSARDFYAHLIEMFDLALAGALTTRTIQAFVNAYQYIAVVQDLKDSVVDAQTDHPDLAGQFMTQLVSSTAVYPNAP